MNINLITNQADLMKMKKEIENRIDEIYYRKENFMYHDKIDYYLYVVVYPDRKITYETGKKAYDNFISDECALCVQRKTKDLFPTYELLLER